jgi:hypothetical protein
MLSLKLVVEDSADLLVMFKQSEAFSPKFSGA